MRLVKNAVLNLELEQIEEIMDLPKTVCAEKEGKNLTTIGKIWTGCENQGKYVLLIRNTRQTRCQSALFVIKNQNNCHWRLKKVKIFQMAGCTIQFS